MGAESSGRHFGGCKAMLAGVVVADHRQAA
jgi:hypothetical protein